MAQSTISVRLNSEENMATLKRSIKQLDSGKGKIHDIIEVDE